jgi:hypothetical protein
MVLGIKWTSISALPLGRKQATNAVSVTTPFRPDCISQTVPEAKGMQQRPGDDTGLRLMNLLLQSGD